MRITVHRVDQSIIVNLDGELNTNTSEECHEKISSLIEEGGKYLIIDCALLTYISSAGLRVFYQALDRIESQGGKILFCRLNEEVKQIFQIVNMSSEFPTFTTIEEAIRSLQ